MLRVAASVPDWGCSHYRSRADGLDRPCTEAWRCGPDPRLRLVSVSYTAFNHAAETRMVLTVFPRRAALSGRVFLSGAKDSSAVGPLSTSAFPSPTTTIAERGKKSQEPCGIVVAHPACLRAHPRAHAQSCSPATRPNVSPALCPPPLAEALAAIQPGSSTAREGTVWWASRWSTGHAARDGAWPGLLTGLSFSAVVGVVLPIPCVLKTCRPVCNLFFSPLSFLPFLSSARLFSLLPLLLFLFVRAARRLWKCPVALVATLFDPLFLLGRSCFSSFNCINRQTDELCSLSVFDLDRCVLRGASSTVYNLTAAAGLVASRVRRAPLLLQL